MAAAGVQAIESARSSQQKDNLCGPFWAARILREAGIEVPFPQRDLHLRAALPEVGKALGTRPER